MAHWLGAGWLAGWLDLIGPSLPPWLPSSLHQQPGPVSLHRLAVPGSPRAASSCAESAHPRLSSLACSEHLPRPLWPLEGIGAVSALARHVFRPWVRARPSKTLDPGSASAPGGKVTGSPAFPLGLALGTWADVGPPTLCSSGQRPSSPDRRQHALHPASLLVGKMTAAGCTVRVCH